MHHQLYADTVMWLWSHRYSRSRSRSFADQVYFLFLSVFYSFFPVFLSMLCSYLDHMTGFYLWFSVAYFLTVLSYPLCCNLLIKFHVDQLCSDDVSLLTSSHISLDSAYTMRSVIQVGHHIPTIIRPRQPKAFNHISNNRTRVLSSLPQQIRTVTSTCTRRKPSDDGPYGRVLLNNGRKFGVENSYHARIGSHMNVRLSFLTQGYSPPVISYNWNERTRKITPLLRPQ